MERLSHHFRYCFAVFDARIVCVYSFLHCLYLHRFILCPFGLIQTSKFDCSMQFSKVWEFTLKRKLEWTPCHHFWAILLLQKLFEIANIHGEMKRKDLKNFLSWIRIFFFLKIEKKQMCCTRKTEFHAGIHDINTGDEGDTWRKNMVKSVFYREPNTYEKKKKIG